MLNYPIIKLNLELMHLPQPRIIPETLNNDTIDVSDSENESIINLTEE